MKIGISKNKYTKAFSLLVIISAAAHLLLLTGFSLYSFDPYHLNYLNILDLDLIFPGILNSDAGNIASWGIVAGIYGTILKVLH